MEAPCLIRSIVQYVPEAQEPAEALQNARSLSEMVSAARRLGLALAVRMVNEVLAARAAEPREWGRCPTCGGKIRSKGWASRQLETSIGCLSWRRRVGRCPAGCQIGQSAPFDEVLGVMPGQRTSRELRSHACLLAVFVPYETASAILRSTLGVAVSSSSIWTWVRQAGQRAGRALDQEIEALHAGTMPAAEAIDEKVRQMMVILGADGVMVPFRPHEGKRDGTTTWREVKVAVIARVKQTVGTLARPEARLHHRRLVAVLGNIDALGDRLRLEAKRQQISVAPTVTWVSDGARGFWRLFEEHFAGVATGVLDFYHAAGQLWEGADAIFGLPASTAEWFAQARHTLRHQGAESIIAELSEEVDTPYFEQDRIDVIRRVRNYFRRHRDHLRFPDFDQEQRPLGSGFVESAVKWLIQQRFKGVGMRWSTDGFNHLLLLRLAWANDRFDDLFLPDPPPSPI